MKYVFVFALIICNVKLNGCFPYNSSVISKYSKVALYGKNNTNSSETRDTGSGNIYNHRLDQKSIVMDTKKTPSVAYQYPVYHRPEEKIDQHIKHQDGIGEVIVKQAQDRFEARPLFAYKNKLAATYGPPPTSKVTYAPSPSVTASPPLATPIIRNTYNSPYTSYNPPKFNQDDSDTISNLYPPNLPTAPSKSNLMNSASTTAVMMDLSPSTEAIKTMQDSYASLGLPLAPPKQENHNHYGNHDYHDHVSYEQHDYQDHSLPKDSMAIYKYNNEAPDHPPKSLDDVYYPPDFPKDQIRDHGMDHNMSEDYQQPIDDFHEAPMTQQDDQMMMPQGDQMTKPDMTDQEKSNDDNAPHDYGDYKFPKYLYDQDHDHDHHHVYEEIPHTTMAPAKEDKRVSSANYSYYYLGRKLWYIPLYFSIYFIIYVTVLILKSIARHKVRLKYKWYEHDTSAKQARSMDSDSSRIEETTILHRNVLNAIQNATDKYKDLAM